MEGVRSVMEYSYMQRRTSLYENKTSKMERGQQLRRGMRDVAASPDRTAAENRTITREEISNGRKK